MKLAITGKGGVGKTTIAALLVQYLAARGGRVIAVDADPDANLASALGFEDRDTIVPIAKMDELVRERTGAGIGESGSFFSLNPRVDDIPEKFSLVKGPVRLLVMGGIRSGGGGCACPENSLLKALMSQLVFYEGDHVIMDMEAGIEHLGRGTASAVDRFIVVVEPGQRSIETAHRIRDLAADMGISRISVIGNKIRTSADEESIRKSLPDMSIAGFFPYQQQYINADMDGKGVPFENGDLVRSIFSTFI